MLHLVQPDIGRPSQHHATSAGRQPAQDSPRRSVRGLAVRLADRQPRRTKLALQPNKEPGQHIQAQLVGGNVVELVPQISGPNAPQHG